jgi:hypothetical protein
MWVWALLCFIEFPEPYTHFIWVFRLMVLLGIGCHTFYIIRRDYLLTHTASVTACLYNKGAWQLILANGDKIDVTLHGDTLIWYELLVLGFIFPSGRKQFIAIFPDTCDKNTQRQLRVELRLYASNQKKISTFEKLKSLCIGLTHRDF